MFVIFNNPNQYMRGIFEGYSQIDVRFQNEFTSILNSLHHVHTSISLNQKFNIPLKHLWYNKYLDYAELDRCESNGEKIFFVFFEGNRQAYDKEFIMYLRQRFRTAKFIFRYINVINQYNAIFLPYVKKNFDLLVSMELADCKKFGMLYVHNTYFFKICNAETKRLKTDILFIGENKGRHKLLCQLYEKYTTMGLKCDFYVSNVSKAEQRKKYSGIHYINNMNYSKYIENVFSSKAILEIISENQEGSTLRAMEAAYFDKYLITNNISIVYEDFYSERAVIFYNDTNEIKKRISENSGIEWKNKNNIEHNYLFKKIESEFE